MTAENIRAIVAKASPSEDDSHDSHMTEDGDDGILLDTSTVVCVF